MDDNGMWEHKYTKYLNESRGFQDEMKMVPIKLGGSLSELQEASKHLPDKKFKEIVKQELGMSPASAYRYINVYEDLKWNPELVKRLKWSVLEQIVGSDLPPDYKMDLIMYAEPDLTNTECQKIIRLLGEGKVNRDDPKWQAYLTHRQTVKDYNQQRDIEKNGFADYLKGVGTSLTAMADSNLTMDEAGKQRIKELASAVKNILSELENILMTNSVEPSFNPQQKKSQN